ncbi:hypothetical protein BaRGS_00036422 [Batillaria attramentaria]|uniref:Uncharacterized protein n=1 Tax=Batillaria attramentaria TaxID=370345 RepID=A0ABD0JBH5_9CAEN
MTTSPSAPLRDKRTHVPHGRATFVQPTITLLQSLQLPSASIVAVLGLSEPTPNGTLRPWLLTIHNSPSCPCENRLSTITARHHDNAERLPSQSSTLADDNCVSSIT